MNDRHDMSHEPLVTVVMPAYNAERFIRPALESALAQTYSNLEIIVVDDGSQDETASIVRSFAQRDSRVTLLQQSNAGVARARNLAIEEGHGDFIAPLDSDDIWYPTKIERQVQAALEGGPTVGLVYSWWEIIDDQGEVRVTSIMPSSEGWVFDTLLRRNFIGNASVPLIRRSCIAHIGGYNAEMRELKGQGCEDWDISLRIAEHYEFRVVREYLVGYRKVDSSMSTACRSMSKSHELMLEGVVQRRPDVSRAFCRSSKAGFSRYLARTCYIDGDHAEALYWTYRAFRLDPRVLLKWKILFIALTSLPLLLIKPLVVRMWPNRRAWLQIRSTLQSVMRHVRGWFLRFAQPGRGAT